MKTTIAVLTGLFLSFFGGGVYMAKNSEVKDFGMSCPAIMKICPDGTNATRATSSCGFLPCNKDTKKKNPGVKEALLIHLNESIVVNGVSLTPLAIIEDSRCPISARCIRAGTVRVRTALFYQEKKSEAVLTLGEAYTLSDKEIMLSHVSEVPVVPKEKESFSYTFEFSVKNLSVTETGDLSGSMVIGPNCPVEMVDRPCVTSGEVYAAHKVYIQSTINKRLAITLTPNAEGKFHVSLPVGTYIVDVDHSKIGGVTGAPQTFVIKKGTESLISISIDTGIRLPVQTNR